MKSTLWFLPLLLLVFSLLGTVPASAQSNRVKIRLAGPAVTGVRPQGSAEFRTEPRRQKFEVEVNRVNLANGTTLTVNVNGVAIGTITLVAGAGQLELESEHRQTVPAIKTGDVVSITSANGTVLSGTF